MYGTPLLVPPGVTAVICTVPLPGGATAVPPKFTAVAVDSPVPLMVTVLPPSSGRALVLNAGLKGAPME